MSQGPQTFYIETLGCQMNKLDSELISTALTNADMTRVDRPEQADLAVLNTCSVRRHAEDKALSRVGHWHYLRQQTARPALIAIVGCFAQRSPEYIEAKADFVDIVCGPGRLHELTELVRTRSQGPTAVAVDDFRAARSVGIDPAPGLEDFDLAHQISTGRFQAFVRTQRGCDKFCSYCIVPFVRGPEISRPVEHILDEVRRLDRDACKQITLLGQTVSSYRYQQNGRAVGLADLLYAIHETTSIPRIRFITSYPADFPIEVLHAIAELERVLPYLHLPAQHGANPVLKRMNRKYTVEQYCELIDHARTIVPEISLAGDFIAGFPGETEKDHQASIELIRRVRYKNCFVFKYSPRPQTPAERRYTDDVPDQVKSRRTSELLDVQNKIAEQDNRQLLGRTVEILVEGPSKRQRKGEQGPHQLAGRTIDDKIVVFDGPAELIGDIITVKIENVSALTLFARRM